MKTLAQILVDVNAVMDLDASQPNGDELSTRSNYADQIVWDVSATGQLSEFKREYLTTCSTLATLSLPTDFREPMQNPRLYLNGGWEEWDLIEVEQKYDRPSTDRYCYVMGDPAGGYNMIFNAIEPTDQLSVIYQRYPSGLLTLTDKCELSDPQVVVKGVQSYVLYSRSDDRFPTADSRYQQSLANMMGREMKGTTGGARTTKSTFTNPLRK